MPIAFKEPETAISVDFLRILMSNLDIPSTLPLLVSDFRLTV